jgi:hypothetical protein
MTTVDTVMRRRRSITGLTATLAAAAAALCLAAPAPAAEVGVNALGLEPQQALDHTQSLGAGWVRLFVRWDQIEAAGPGRWDPHAVRGLDELVAGAQARKIKVLFVVLGTPSWANGANDVFIPPRDPSTYGRFMRSLAARYEGRVQAWEIWNEPDEGTFWRGSKPSPTNYAPLLRAAYEGVKSADPAALVLAAASTGNDYPFLEGLYRAGARGTFDGVAVHTDTACLVNGPQSFYREADGRIARWSFLGFRTMHDVMTANGDGAKPIFITEIGWSATQTDCARGMWAGKKAAGVGEAKQAQFLREGFRCLEFYPYVRAALWFSLSDVGSADNELNRYGLLRWNGTRRPSWDALAAAARGDNGSGGCGDFEAPSVEVLAPTPGTVYDRYLVVRAAARDGSRAPKKITLYGNGRKVRSWGDLKPGRPIEMRWMGARRLPYGDVTITVEAYDQNDNVTRTQVKVRRVNPATLPPQRTQVALRLSGKGRKRTVRGRVSAPGSPFGAAFEPTGKVLVKWQTKRGRKWITLHKMGRGAARPFRYTQRLRYRGAWRVVAQYQGERPFRASTSSIIRFRAR